MATIYRNYKDNVFCLLYRDRANLLQLYNGLNGTDHKDPEELTVVTLPNTICIQYKKARKICSLSSIRRNGLLPGMT